MTNLTMFGQRFAEISRKEFHCAVYFGGTGILPRVIQGVVIISHRRVAEAILPQRRFH